MPNTFQALGTERVISPGAHMELTVRLWKYSVNNFGTSHLFMSLSFIYSFKEYLANASKVCVFLQCSCNRNVQRTTRIQWSKNLEGCVIIMEVFSEIVSLELSFTRTMFD